MLDLLEGAASGRLSTTCSVVIVIVFEGRTHRVRLLTYKAPSKQSFTGERWPLKDFKKRFRRRLRLLVPALVPSAAPLAAASAAELRCVPGSAVPAAIAAEPPEATPAAAGPLAAA